jgi:hypothetical protein
MQFSVELKVVYGNSYVPDLTNGNQYGSMYRRTSNQLSFPSGNPTMSLSGMSTLA